MPRQSAAVIVLCPRAEYVVSLLFLAVSVDLILVPSSVCSPCLQTGRLESPTVVLRAVIQAAFGSTPFSGNSLFSLVFSTTSVNFVCVHTSSQIRCSYFPVVLRPCHDTAVVFYADEYYSQVTCYFQVFISIHNFCWLAGNFRWRNQKQ